MAKGSQQASARGSCSWHRAGAPAGGLTAGHHCEQGCAGWPRKWGCGGQYLRFCSVLGGTDWPHWPNYFPCTRLRARSSTRSCRWTTHCPPTSNATCKTETTLRTSLATSTSCVFRHRAQCGAQRAPDGRRPVMQAHRRGMDEGDAGGGAARSARSDAGGPDARDIGLL
jgi:hypothetical protein